jgi:hypothetical protein
MNAFSWRPAEPVRIKKNAVELPARKLPPAKKSLLSLLTSPSGFVFLSHFSGVVEGEGRDEGQVVRGRVALPRCEQVHRVLVLGRNLTGGGSKTEGPERQRS